MARPKSRARKGQMKPLARSSGPEELWSTLAKIAEGLAESTRLLPPSTTCGCCGQKFSDPEVLAAHVEARAYRTRKRKPGPAAAAARPAGGDSPRPTPKPKPAPRSKPTPKPAPASARTSGGSVAPHASVQMLNRVGTQMPEEVDADTKLGELDALLLSLRYAQLRLAEGVSELADRLVSEVWLDPQVAQAVEETASSIAESSQGWQEARRRIRIVYAEQIEARESGRKQPRGEFFDD